MQTRTISRKTLGAIVAATLLAILAVRSATDSSFLLADRVQDFFVLTFSVIIESSPFVVLGVLLAAVLQLVVRQEKILSLLPKNKAARQVVLSFLGILLPVCECGNLPLARGLMLKGLSVSEATTFLLAAPIINPLTIITTHQAFGWDNGVLVARLIGGFVIANFIGWLFSQHSEPTSFLTKEFNAACAHNHEPKTTHGFKGKIVGISSMFGQELKVMVPPLLIGASLAGLIQVIVPKQALLAVGQNLVASMIAMVLLGLVVAICSNVDAFFALSFAGTFLPGSIVVFLLVGPLVDVKMIALMKTTYKTHAVALIMAVVITLSVVVGLVVNTFVS